MPPCKAKFTSQNLLKKREENRLQKKAGVKSHIKNKAGANASSGKKTAARTPTVGSGASVMTGIAAPNEVPDLTVSEHEELETLRLTVKTLSESLQVLSDKNMELNAENKALTADNASLEGDIEAMESWKHFFMGLRTDKTAALCSGMDPTGKHEFMW